MTINTFSPQAPFYDPVHGVFHYFYQQRLSWNEGYFIEGAEKRGFQGPIQGHWVSNLRRGFRGTGKRDELG